MSEVKKRKSIQTIKDPLLEPFFITKDEYSYTIKQNVVSDSSHFRSKGKSKTYEKSLHYYPTLPKALTKIAELKSNMEDYDGLDQFIAEYKLISKQIKQYADDFKSL